MLIAHRTRARTQVLDDTTPAGDRPAVPPIGSEHIVLVEFPPSGGLFQFSLQLGEALSRRGHEVSLLTGPRPELRSREPACVVRSVLPTWHPTAGSDAPEWWRRARRVARGAQHVTAWLCLLAWLERAKPDVVLWSAWRFPVDGWGVRLVRRLLPSATLALVAHEPRPLVEQPGAGGHYKSNHLLQQALSAAYEELDAVFVLGAESEKVLRETWPVTAPVTVIPHGDEGVFVTGRDPTPPASDAPPTALFFGTITGYKGIHELLACWPLVHEAVPEAELVIAGNVGADVDAADLRRLVASLPGVKLRAGYVPVEGVAPLMCHARLVVLPYRRGSQSGVAHLAFTFARPVVATAVGDIPSVVTHDRTGLLVPCDGREALAAAMIDLLTDRRRAGRLGSAGQASLQTGASWDEVAATLVSGLPVRGGALIGSGAATIADGVDP